jgi:hypothetical protein
MSLSERIRIILDLDDKGVLGGLKRVRTEVDQADGAFGKLKAGAGGLGGVMKDNLAGLAVGAATAAGAAIAAFAADGVRRFQELALSAGKFGDATGVTTEEASRLIEVAGDLGIESGTLQGAIGKLNKAIGDGTLDFKELGAEIVRTKDGNVDVNASFLNVAEAIGRIEDPTKRQIAAQKAFGRNWTEISELMGQDADVLRGKLADVSDEKVIDDEELQKARDYREAVDNLKGIFEDLSLEVGGAVVPILTDMANALKNVDGAIKSVTGEGGISQFIETLYKFSGLSTFVDGINGLADAMDPANASFKEGATTLAELQQAQLDQAKAAEEGAETNRLYGDRMEYVRSRTNAAKDETKKLDEAYQDLTGQLDDRESWLNLITSVDEFFWKMNSGTLSTREQEQALIDIQQELIDYLSGLEGVPASKQTEILTLIESGQIAEARRELDELTKNRYVNVIPRTVSGGNSPSGTAPYVPGGAAGLPTTPGSAYQVTEDGPEMYTEGGKNYLLTGGKHGAVIPMRPTGAGAGATITVGPVHISNGLDLDAFARRLNMMVAS